MVIAISSGVIVYAVDVLVAARVSDGLTVSPSPTVGQVDAAQQRRFVFWFSVGSWVSLSLFGGALLVAAACQAILAAIEARASRRAGLPREKR